MIKKELMHFNKWKEGSMLIYKVNLIDDALYCVISDV